jgi:hypothetical protein
MILASLTLILSGGLPQSQMNVQGNLVEHPLMGISLPRALSPSLFSIGIFIKIVKGYVPYVSL